MHEAHFYCGGIQPAGKPKPNTHRLITDGGHQDPNRIALELSEITRPMVASLPDRIADIVEIASYVYCADQIVPREPSTMPGMGARWRRRLHFHIALRDPAFWTNKRINKNLTDTLGFLSEDEFSFAFEASKHAKVHQAFFEMSGAGPEAGFQPAAAVLFSGGLDSFAGTIDALARDLGPLVLVSHRSSDLVASIQRQLVQTIHDRASSHSVFHVPVRIRLGKSRAREFTQRTRSFLFAALAFAVATMMKTSRIVFYENGVVSLNLPLTAHVIGSRATRTTHPRSLRHFSDLFSAIADRQIIVDNPYFWLTKTDVVERIIELGHAASIPRTLSCANVREATRLRGRHCGRCSQCIDRRFGVLGAGGGAFEPSDGYEVELLRGERQPGPDAAMAVGYVLSAIRHAGSNIAQFLSTYGEVFRAIPYLVGVADTTATRLHNLHVRHGRQVEEVIRRAREEGNLSRQLLDLADTSLLAMIQAPGSTDLEFSQPAMATIPVPEPTKETAPDGRLRFALDRSARCIRIEQRSVSRGRSFDLFIALLPNFMAGISEGMGDHGHRFMKAAELARKLGLEEDTLRKQIGRFRDKLAASLSDMALARDAVIENDPWHGYRLNPRLVHDSSMTVEQVAGTASVRPFADSSQLGRGSSDISIA